MEDLNYKLEGLKDTVKKIKKEIKSFEENESKNIQNRTNTFSNKIYRHSSYSRKSHLNKLNKRLIKNYFKLSLKEQDFYNNKNSNYKNNKNNIKDILTPQLNNKNINRAKKYLTKQSSKKSKNFKNEVYKTIKKKISNNNDNDNDNDYNNKYNNKNLSQKKILLMTDINNTINNYNNFNDSSMNKNLFKFMTTRNKDNAMNQKIEDKNINKFEQSNKIIKTYSNDFKKNIFSNYFNKNKKNNKKEFLYNINNYNNYNYDFNNDENISNNINDSTFFNSKKNYKNNRVEKVNISDLVNIKFNNEKSCSNKNIKNNNFFNANQKIDISKNQAINDYKNKSYNGKIKLIQNLIDSNNNYKEPIQNQQLSKNNNDYYSYRQNFNNNVGRYTIGDEILNSKKYWNKESNSILEYNHYNKKQINFPMNNTINYIKNNNNDIGLYYDDEEIINKNKIKDMIGNYSIGDLFIKAKLFEKCGENNFKKFVNNFCKTNDINNNLKKYKNFIIQIKNEENQYKNQINIYQKLCKKMIELMNPNEINEIINEIQDYIYENEGSNNYFDEQIKLILN